jgi:hypothetical protein
LQFAANVLFLLCIIKIKKKNKPLFSLVQVEILEIAQGLLQKNGIAC